MTTEQFDPITIDTRHNDFNRLKKLTSTFIGTSALVAIGFGVAHAVGGESADAESCKNATTHTVQKGETLSEIAAEKDYALFELENKNPEIIGRQIRAEQVIVLPPRC